MPKTLYLLFPELIWCAGLGLQLVHFMISIFQWNPLGFDGLVL